ncbi:MAG: hypothetical protein QG611_1328, partial [Bacteroidota bacterium]|nr:hypothetical protein [Bacteroidota bacterium]
MYKNLITLYPKLARMKKLSVILISILFFATAFSQIPDSLKYNSLEPYEFHLRYLKEDSSMLIDVRELGELRKQIRGAVNIPSTGNLDFAADTICKRKSLFIYCNHGNRSKRIAIFFYDKGFRKLYSLEGGILAWRKEGFRVVRSPGNKKR